MPSNYHARACGCPSYPRLRRSSYRVDERNSLTASQWVRRLSGTAPPELKQCTAPAGKRPGSFSALFVRKSLTRVASNSNDLEVGSGKREEEKREETRLGRAISEVLNRQSFVNDSQHFQPKKSFWLRATHSRTTDTERKTCLDRLRQRYLKWKWTRCFARSPLEVRDHYEMMVRRHVAKGYSLKRMRVLAGRLFDPHLDVVSRRKMLEDMARYARAVQTVVGGAVGERKYPSCRHRSIEGSLIYGSALGVMFENSDFFLRWKTRPGSEVFCIQEERTTSVQVDLAYSCGQKFHPRT